MFLVSLVTTLQCCGQFSVIYLHLSLTPLLFLSSPILTSLLQYSNIRKANGLEQQAQRPFPDPPNILHPLLIRHFSRA
jgi:hypothetical protein